MDENSVRTLLESIASAPEPPPRVDLDRARRRGRRWLWARRTAAPALTVAAVVGTLTVPHAFSVDHSERTVVPPQHTSSPVSLTAPARFDPLVPYASFGWLPRGFSEAAAASIDYDSGFAAASDFVSLEAAAPSAGHLLYLEVSSRGACALTAAAAARGVRAGAVVQVTCTDDQFAVTGPAPDVAGHPAVQINYGEGIAWEYAPGAWASLRADITPAADEPHSRRQAAQDGWVIVARSRADRPTGDLTPARIRADIKAGKLIPPSAATQALLVKVASQVRYGQRTPLAFPFRMTRPLPAGWRLTSTSFTPSGGRLLGTGVSAGPAADRDALSISAAIGPNTACPFYYGQSSYVTQGGVRWVYRVIDETDKHVQSLCATTAVDGLADAGTSLDMNTPGSNAPLPGSAELGGALGVLARTRFLGTDPARWTAAPVG